MVVTFFFFFLNFVVYHRLFLPRIAHFIHMLILEVFGPCFDDKRDLRGLSCFSE